MEILQIVGRVWVCRIWSFYTGLIHDEGKYGAGCSDYARNDGGIYKLFPEGSVPGVFASAGSSANTAVFGISGYFFAAFLASHGRHSNDG